MSYRLQRSLILMLALGFSSLLFAACSRGSDTAGNEAASDGPHQTAAGAATTSAKSSSTEPAGPDQIVIDNFAFKPAKLTVKPGTKVTWINHDDVPHTATSTDKRFNSGTLDTDAQFSFVFTDPGTYDYFCALHPKMTGQITVK